MPSTPPPPGPAKAGRPVWPGGRWSSQSKVDSPRKVRRGSAYPRLPQRRLLKGWCLGHRQLGHVLDALAAPGVSTGCEVGPGERTRRQNPRRGAPGAGVGPWPRRSRGGTPNRPGRPPGAGRSLDALAGRSTKSIDTGDAGGFGWRVASTCGSTRQLGVAQGPQPALLGADRDRLERRARGPVGSPGPPGTPLRKRASSALSIRPETLTSPRRSISWTSRSLAGEDTTQDRPTLSRAEVSLISRLWR